MALQGASLHPSNAVEWTDSLCQGALLAIGGVDPKSQPDPPSGGYPVMFQARFYVV